MNMTQQELFKAFESLPIQVQRQALNFIAFLQQTYAPAIKPQKTEIDWTNDPFIEMWQVTFLLFNHVSKSATFSKSNTASANSANCSADSLSKRLTVFSVILPNFRSRQQLYRKLL